MNKSYDYGGVQVAFSKPVQKLRTVKKTIYIDSGDRDTVKYTKNGDCVIYLPRVYEKVVSINVRSAEFPSIVSAKAHSYSTTTLNDATLTSPPLYFLLEFGGLNKADETAPGADRSARVDGVFAKFQVPAVNTEPIYYTESSGQKNIEYYSPAISKLDRLQLRLRLHTQKGGNSTTNPEVVSGHIYWSTGEFSLTVEVETMENAFDDFSSLETRVAERA
jgi:hypothetical protein